MSIIFILLILIAALLFIIVLTGLFLPTDWVVEKAELINASANDIFPMINQLKSWEDWTVWYSKNGGDFVFSYEGTTQGKNAVQNWKSKYMNTTLTILKSSTNQQIDYKMLIHEGNLSLRGTIVLASADANFTQVAWRCGLQPIKGSNPIRRFQAFFIKSYFEKAIEDSLLSLQSIFANE